MIDWATVLPVVLGIIGTAIGAWGYTQKTKAQTDLERVKNEAKEFDQLMKLVNLQTSNLQKQIEVNHVFTMRLEQQAQKDEQNYQTLKLLYDRQAWEIRESAKKGQKEIIKRLDALPGEIAAMNVTALKAVAGEIATAVGEIIREAFRAGNGNDQAKGPVEPIDQYEERKGEEQQISGSGNVSSGGSAGVTGDGVGAGSRTTSRGRGGDSRLVNGGDWYHRHGAAGRRPLAGGTGDRGVENQLPT